MDYNSEERLTTKFTGGSSLRSLVDSVELGSHAFVAVDMEEYLSTSEVIDRLHPEIIELAKQIASGHETSTAIAKASFEWVRDEICHSFDYETYA